LQYLVISLCLALRRPTSFVLVAIRDCPLVVSLRYPTKSS
jgi:hypothetical protein